MRSPLKGAARGLREGGRDRGCEQRRQAPVKKSYSHDLVARILPTARILVRTTE